MKKIVLFLLTTISYALYSQTFTITNNTPNDYTINYSPCNRLGASALIKSQKTIVIQTEKSGKIDCAITEVSLIEQKPGASGWVPVYSIDSGKIISNKPGADIQATKGTITLKYDIPVITWEK